MDYRGIYISPLASIRVMVPQLARAVAFSLIAILPTMVVHCALSIRAVFVDGDVVK
ncbi:MAG: hypothetical protein WA948_01720 [Pontixanthobacter sp.]